MIDISICIPTYNRADLLAPLFSSFHEIRDVSFEVILVNDGSTDNTVFELNRLCNLAKFPMVRIDQPNSGRGAALNRAFEHARGQFLFIMDDDDCIAEGALKAILDTWNSIAPDVRNEFCGVCGLCVDRGGRIIGQPFPRDVEDTDFFTMRVVRDIRGDKREVFLKALLGNFRFPSAPGEKRVATGILWLYLAARYKMRFVNVPFLVKTYRPDGISVNGLRQRVKSPTLTREYYRGALELFPRMPISNKLQMSINYFRFAWHAGDTVTDSWRRLPARGLARAMLPLGLAIAIGDQLKLRIM